MLVMDDEAALLRAAGRILGHLGYDHEMVADGAAAVRAYEDAMAEDRRFDAVIMDLTVPGGMGGIEAIAALRALDPDIQTIVSSGYSNDAAMAEFGRYGFVAVLAKPYDSKALGHALDRAVSGS